jgi:hypothetical protein
VTNSSSDVTIKGAVFKPNAGSEGGALKQSVKSALVSECSSTTLQRLMEGHLSPLCERQLHLYPLLCQAQWRSHQLSQPSLTNNSAGYDLLRSSADSNAEGKLIRLFSSQGGRNVRVGLVNNYGKLVKTDNHTIADIKIPDAKSRKGVSAMKSMSSMRSS